MGYPERASLAWDADEMRPALIWHNAFLDASKHWTGRGQGFQQPLGDHVLSLPRGAPLARLPDARAAWPAESAQEQGFRFLGYRLDEQRRPVFRYRFAGYTVEDSFVPVAGEPDSGFRRTLTLSRKSSGSAPEEPANTLWLRAATGNIESLTEESSAKSAGEDGSGWLVDGILRIRFPQGGMAGQPVLREAKGGSELLIPLQLTDGTATLVQTYQW